jgi:demethylmenaquinone methyltransferase/2-methoxy-6-polyprenyl-1,4-benzoquinol methylase
MNPSRAQTRANYDRLSRRYDLLAGSSERALRDLGLRELAIRDGEHVLEVGCGTGAALVELARAAGPAGLAVGLDLSLGMCRKTALRISDSRLRIGGPLSAAVVCGDAARVPLVGSLFDAAFMSFALELFNEGDMRAVLAQCRRVLRPGGRLCVVAMAEPVRRTLMTRLYAWAHERFPTAVDCRPIPVSAVLAAGGFRVERAIRRSLWGLPVEIAVSSAPA